MWPTLWVWLFQVKQSKERDVFARSLSEGEGRSAVPGASREVEKDAKRSAGRAQTCRCHRRGRHGRALGNRRDF